MGSKPAASILLVEDNEDIREGLSILLESEGYDITAVGSAEEGLALLKARGFHVVVTDYMLTGESGGWMVEQASQAGCLNHARVLMITAHPRVVPPQGVRILHKPLDIDFFLRVVEEERAASLQREAKAG
ncbi:response regulator [Hyalangium minutum]|uniref:Adenylate cyclase n=1 Tax=Hyalangium minutum TaxID=394096 RepID=A0A085W9E8_9BACT|nr:response regulator [Hyalangium minutum]KFE64311.1 Adenylate cyclase [Hyalangium minutum]